MHYAKMNITIYQEIYDATKEIVAEDRHLEQANQAGGPARLS